MPASRLSWQLTIRHCPSDCHSHVAESFAGVAGGSFFGPDHEYPAHLELTLTATDAQGATASTTRELHPKTVILSFATAPSGLELGVNATTTTAPFTREVIKGSLNSLSASSPQTLGSTTYQFTGWSDGGGASHIVTANAAATFTASFTATGSSTTLVPVADAEIRSKQPARNFGTLPTLSVRNGMLRSYLRFNVPTLSGTVAGARLRLFVVEAGTAGGSAFAVGSSWTETGYHLEQRPANLREFAGNGRCGNGWDLGGVRRHIRNRKRQSGRVRCERWKQQCGGLLQPIRVASTPAGDNHGAVTLLVSRTGPGARSTHARWPARAWRRFPSPRTSGHRGRRAERAARASGVVRGRPSRAPSRLQRRRSHR